MLAAVEQFSGERVDGVCGEWRQLVARPRRAVTPGRRRCKVDGRGHRCVVGAGRQQAGADDGGADENEANRPSDGLDRQAEKRFHEDRVCREAERNKMAWCYWEFGAGFGVFDRGAGKWRESLKSALLDANR